MSGNKNWLSVIFGFILVTALTVRGEAAAVANPAVKKSFRILLFGPGLAAPELQGDMSPAKQLEKRLNRKCANCFSVSNAAIPGNFLAENFHELKKRLETGPVDLIVYYESAVFLSEEMRSVYLHKIDEDSDDLIPKSAGELYANPCCEFFLKLLPENLRRQVADVLNYIDTYRRARLKERRDLLVLLDPVFQGFSLFAVKARHNRSSFIVLLDPYGFRPDQCAFGSSLFQDVLFKMLVHFYAPQRVSIERNFVNQGFDVEVMNPEAHQLYQASYLMYRHRYNLNAAGAEAWAQYAAASIQKYLKSMGKAVDVR